MPCVSLRPDPPPASSTSTASGADGTGPSRFAPGGSGGIFYVYDTTSLSDADTLDHREHRDLVASLAKRSRFFLVAPAKMDASGECQGQSEIGSRYYEGAAAGAVLIGSKPDGDPFQELFGWPDAVVDINADGLM
jgi:hypothetical protein